MAELKLTLVERCILRNQFEILAALKPDQATHFEQACKVVENGWEHDYAEFVGADITPEPLSFDRCVEVRHILDMYIAMQRGLPENDDTARGRAKFPGFPSAEIQEQLYVRWMRERDEYEPLIVGTYQALPQLEKYRAMLRVYTSWNNPGELTAGQSDVLLAAYAEAKAYPSA